MRTRVGEIDSSIWIDEAWHPELQQVNDAAILELLAYLTGAKTQQLDECNQVLVYFMIITFGDTAHE